jgi:threonine dehydrogenase-like Zn-dependent dehydrogenase
VKPASDILNLLRHGAHVIVDATGAGTPTLLELAAAARAAKGHVTLTGLNHKPASDLEAIAANGGPHVTLELS